MAEVHGRPTVTLQITMALTEEEARALEAVAGYDERATLKILYTHAGRAYLEPHEAGFLSLMRSARASLPLWLKRADTARKAFTQTTTTGGASDE